MQQLLYIEVPAPTEAVRAWLQAYRPAVGFASMTSDGFRLRSENAEWVCFVWQLQRTSYLKVFRWSATAPAQAESGWIDRLQQDVQAAFPMQYAPLPQVNLTSQTIFEALRPFYPLTVHYFQTRVEDGEYALKKAYWWEKRWREGVREQKRPMAVIFRGKPELPPPITYDLIYCGAALGIIHAAAMARLGWRVAVIDRGPFGAMNREWNISRSELEALVALGLFSREQIEGLILNEYYDGLNKFYDGNVPARAKGKLLHTPTVLNIALDAEKLLHLCGEQVLASGGDIFDCTEFERIDVWDGGIAVEAYGLNSGERLRLGGRLCIDAMGSASPIAAQLTGGRAFDSVCPTVGAVVRGFDPGVWDTHLGDVLYSHGDISRGRQLIWELFPGRGDEMAIYLFYYHQIHPDNPGSLLDLYEDFFTILPEYKRCEVGKLEFKKATFGYIPAGSALETAGRRVALDRLLAIGDAASLQSPLVFTGFGSLVRNLPRLCELLHTALRHDLLTADDLDRVRASQSNIAVTWLFSRAMMVPTGRHLQPERINAILNTFFDILADSRSDLVDDFIKDRLGWLAFNRMALQAAFKNPALLAWVFEVVGSRDFVRWLPAYWRFTWQALLGASLGSWMPTLVRSARNKLERSHPRLWYRLLAWSYLITYGVGRPNGTAFDLG